jgi:hypothetical protein
MKKLGEPGAAARWTDARASGSHGCASQCAMFRLKIA